MTFVSINVSVFPTVHSDFSYTACFCSAGFSTFSHSQLVLLCSKTDSAFRVNPLLPPPFYLTLSISFLT